MPIHERASDDSPSAGLPWQVRAVGWIGVPTAIAGVLLWFLLIIVNGKLDAIVSAASPIKEHIESSKALNVTLSEMERERRESTRRQEKYLGLICLVNAKTEAQRNLCAAVQ